MAVRLRLQRHGKKGKPFYHMVAADARAKRDGRFIEKVGTYNPNTHPATVEINHDRALYWLGVGAQPSDTAKAILKHTGAIYHNHLLKGVAKGALTEEEATKRFEAWYNEKQSKNDIKRDSAVAASDKVKSDLLAGERKVSDARAAKLASAASELAASLAPAVEEAAPAEEVVEEAAPVEEVVEEAAPAAEVVAEEAAPAEEVAPAAEVETPADEDDKKDDEAKA